LALSVPYLNYDQIRAKVEAALSTHHSKRTIPVPIEDIIEFRYGISIVPIPGLLASREIDAFTSKNWKTIYVDQTILEQKSGFRYRFSLAHELGHIELHQDIQNQIQFSSVDEWKAALKRIPENLRSRFEFQAYDFAGLFLVPSEELKRERDQLLKVLERAKFDIKHQADAAKPYLCTRLGKHFEVSQGVIDRRLEKDNLWPP
jgi:Zn-dependent peptidase ImmA (M78 family)